MKTIQTYFEEESFMGFYPSHLALLPFPVDDPGTTAFKRSYRNNAGGNNEVLFSSPNKVPFGKMARNLQCLFVTSYTMRKKTDPENAHIFQYESYREIGKAIGSARNGGEFNEDIRDQLNRLMYTTMHISRTGYGAWKGKDAYGKFNEPINLFQTTGIIEANGRGKKDSELLLVFGERYLKLISSKAIPIDGKAFYGLNKTIEKDLYVWVLSRVHHLEMSGEPAITDKFDDLILHFTDMAPESLSKNRSIYTKRILNALAKIKGELYPNLKVDVADKGIVIMKSPPHIELDSKRLAYAPQTD